MIEHTFVGDNAFQALCIKIRALPEQLRAIRTTAQVHVVVAKLQGDRVLQWFLSQARRAYDQVVRVLKESIRTGDEQIGAGLTAEMVLFTVMAVTN